MTQIDGINYRATKMLPREQHHLFRRLTPLLASVGTPLLGLLDEDADRGVIMANIVQALGPLTDALSSMDDATVDYILDACLTHVERQDAGVGTWHPIYVRQPRGAIRMYADLGSGAELRLCNEVIKLNLSGFFEQLSGGSASSLSAGAAQEA